MLVSILNSAPKKRSKSRLLLGQLYFSTLRYISWYLYRTNYANVKESTSLPFSVFNHQTPLLRRLHNVDMWLQHNKVKNLKLATAKIDGLIVKPVETFSFWRLVGKPTRRKG